eukprot:2825829-Prymnesium_polylepis.2
MTRPATASGNRASSVDIMHPNGAMERGKQLLPGVRRRRRRQSPMNPTITRYTNHPVFAGLSGGSASTLPPTMP